MMTRIVFRTFNRRNAYLFCLVQLMILFTVFLAGCENKDKYGIEPEEYNVYMYFFSNMLQSDTVQPGSIAIHATIRDWPSQWDISYEYAAKELPSLQKSTLDNYKKNNKKSYTLYGLEERSIKFRIIDEEEHDRLFNGIINECGEGCDLYGMAFNELSRVGFNKEKNQALLYFGSRMGPITGIGDIYLLEKEKGKWAIKDATMVWIS